MKDKTLTKDNIKVGIDVIDSKHPEYGIWTVTKDRNGFNLYKANGERIIDPSEYHFYTLA